MVLLNLIALNCLSLIIKLLFPLFVLEKSFFEFSSVWYKCTIKKKKKCKSTKNIFLCSMKTKLKQKTFSRTLHTQHTTTYKLHVTKKPHNINFYLSITYSLIYHWIFFSINILFELVSFSLFFSCKF